MKTRGDGAAFGASIGGIERLKHKATYRMGQRVRAVVLKTIARIAFNTVPRRLRPPAKSVNFCAWRSSWLCSS